MENQIPQINQRIVESTTPNYKRLFGQFNREVIEKMKGLGMEIGDETYDVNEVLRYLGDEKARSEALLEDHNAQKADVFVDWLKKNGTALPNESTQAKTDFDQDKN